MAKTEMLICKSAELKDGDRKIVPNGKHEIGVYRVQGKLYAYQNLCNHQGGPACEGLLMAKVEEVIAEDKTYQGMRFNHDEMHIVCPWHGWEYDLATGEMVADRKFRLKKYDVVEKGDAVYVLV
ncbi:MAG: Rieske (2Fe-2S) protein [Rhodospirillales bacterium]